MRLYIYRRPDPMKQIRCLTSLRFFAAAMIVVLHSVGAFQVGDISQIRFSLVQGVSFFFVLSGFILTYVYPSLSGGNRLRDFYVARFARIWPAHFSTFILLLCLIPSAGWVWKDHQAWQIGATNLFLVHAWIPSARYYFSFNSVSWSISTESFFYLVFPFLLYRLERSWWWKLLGTAAFVAAMLSLTDILGLPSYDATNFFPIDSQGLVCINPLVRILEFVFGMAVASLCLRWRELKILTSLPAWAWTTFEFGAVAVTCLSARYGTPFFCSLFGGLPHAFAMFAATSGSFPAFGLLIGALSFERGMVSRILSTYWLVILGEISYSIYLVHQILIRWYVLSLREFASVPKAVLYIGYWFAVLGISFIIWRGIEKPCQRWIRSRLGSKQRPGNLMASNPAVIHS
jgi:peptidoglycan/LPS O-acetylase OafA/YrhL